MKRRLVWILVIGSLAGLAGLTIGLIVVHSIQKITYYVINSEVAQDVYFQFRTESTRRSIIKDLESNPEWHCAKIGDIELFFRTDEPQSPLISDRTEYMIRFSYNPLDFVLITDYDNNGTADEILFGWSRSSLKARNSMEGFLWLDLGEGSRPWLAGATMYRPEGSESEPSYMAKIFARADALISYLSRIRYELDLRYVAFGPVP